MKHAGRSNKMTCRFLRNSFCVTKVWKHNIYLIYTLTGSLRRRSYSLENSTGLSCMHSMHADTKGVRGAMYCPGLTKSSRNVMWCQNVHMMEGLDTCHVMYVPVGPIVPWTVMEMPSMTRATRPALKVTWFPSMTRATRQFF